MPRGARSRRRAMAKDGMKRSVLLMLLATALMGSGVPGPQFQVNTTTQRGQFLPVIGMNASGASVIVWTSENQDGSGYGVFAQRFDPSGAPQGPEFSVNTTTEGDQVDPAVVMADNGDFVVAWSGNGDGDDQGIFAQRFDSSGAPQGGEFRVNTTTLGLQVHPVMAIDGTGNFILVWETGTAGAGCGFLYGGGIFARRFDPSGIALG